VHVLSPGQKVTIWQERSSGTPPMAQVSAGQGTPVTQ
jgi:hypothetical protein